MCRRRPSLKAGEQRSGEAGHDGHHAEQHEGRQKAQPEGRHGEYAGLARRLLASASRVGPRPLGQPTHGGGHRRPTVRCPGEGPRGRSQRVVLAAGREQHPGLRGRRADGEGGRDGGQPLAAGTGHGRGHGASGGGQRGATDEAGREQVQRQRKVGDQLPSAGPLGLRLEPGEQTRSGHGDARTYAKTDGSAYQQGQGASGQQAGQLRSRRERGTGGKAAGWDAWPGGTDLQPPT